MKKACVFGGSGFLGSHVADCLVDNGYLVTVFDKQPSQWLKDGQEMVIGDILSFDEINEAVAGSDVVYNFAALADLNEGLNKPIETIKINILGNAHVMEACHNHKISRFIYASTVYVNSRDGGFYRCSKQAAENYIEEYQRIFNLDYTILRFGSLYGPRADKANGLYRIVKNAVQSGAVSYQGSSEAIREYIHVTDAARASVVALGEEFRNESVVLTGQEPMKVEDLLKMLAEILGYESKVEFLEKNNIGHYIRTPYSYQPKLGRKFISPMHVDLGQGLIELINQIHIENSSNGSK